MRVPATALAGLALLAVTGCTSGASDPATPRPTPPATPVGTVAAPSIMTPTTTHTYEVTDATSLPAYFDRPFSGGDLQLGNVRERTSRYTSYDVSYRSEELRISGVLNVPAGEGPFPAAVLAHGYIDPAVYVRGQGMPRERVALAEAGYIAFHVDYRNHAQSDAEPDLADTHRLGYAVDVINAATALRTTDAVPVDDGRVALMGRSMGGGVTLKALEMAPGHFGAAAAWASVSSNETDNFRQFSGNASSFWTGVERLRGSPEASPAYWAGVSPENYAERITEPVLLVHGTRDDTCPPAWADHTRDVLERAEVDVTLEWYAGEGHTFNPQFDAAMTRTIEFLNTHLR